MMFFYQCYCWIARVESKILSLFALLEHLKSRGPLDPDIQLDVGLLTPSFMFTRSHIRWVSVHNRWGKTRISRIWILKAAAAITISVVLVLSTQAKAKCHNSHYIETIVTAVLAVALVQLLVVRQSVCTRTSSSSTTHCWAKCHTLFAAPSLSRLRQEKPTNASPLSRDYSSLK